MTKIHDYFHARPALLMTTGAVLSVFMFSFAYVTKADVLIQRLFAQNTAPSIESVVVSLAANGPQATDITLTENETTDLHVYGTISDPNGCRDLERVNVTVYRADLGAACLLDDRNCYSTSTQAIALCSGESDTAASYHAVVKLQNFADPTDAGSDNAATNWIARATVVDQGSLTDSALSPGFEINSIAALGVTATLDFGILHLGEISSPKIIYLTNYGNRPVVPYFVSEGDMACDAGETPTINTTLLHMHTEAQIASVRQVQVGGLTNANDKISDYTADERQNLWDQGIPMDSTQSRTYEESLPQSTSLNGTSIMPVYFTLKVPDSGVEGNCTTVLRVTAVAE